MGGAGHLASIAGTGAALHVAQYHLEGLLAGSTAVLVGAVVAASSGVSLAWGLVGVALTPAVTIVGHEALGHRHLQEHLSTLRS